MASALEDSVVTGDGGADLLEDDLTHEEQGMRQIDTIFELHSATVFDETFLPIEDTMGHDESNGGGEEDPELEAIKARVQAMEEESNRLKEVCISIHMNLSNVMRSFFLFLVLCMYI